jgi:hypothetical protein
MDYSKKISTSVNPQSVQRSPEIEPTEEEGILGGQYVRAGSFPVERLARAA